MTSQEAHNAFQAQRSRFSELLASPVERRIHAFDTSRRRSAVGAFAKAILAASDEQTAAACIRQDQATAEEFLRFALDVDYVSVHPVFEACHSIRDESYAPFGILATAVLRSGVFDT